MKIKELETLRRIELALFLAGTTTASIGCVLQFTPEQIEAANNAYLSLTYNAFQDLESYKDLLKRPELIELFTSLPFFLDYVGGSLLDKNTVEFKKVGELYEQSLEQTTELLKSLALDEPIKIFATYVYLYRNGYLSNNSQFTYSMKLKDAPQIYGADVLAGYGVCRSLASHLSDIYQKMGYTSDVLTVNASRESITSLDKLCETPLQKDELSSKFAKVVGAITSKIKIGNHLITFVKDEGKVFVLDPTNDGMLIPKGGKFITPMNPQAYMGYRPVGLMVNRCLGQIKKNLNYCEINEAIHMPTIDMDEYRKCYLEALEIVKANPELLERFADESQELYTELADILTNQPGLIQRKLPIFPKVKRKTI